MTQCSRGLCQRLDQQQLRKPAGPRSEPVSADLAMAYVLEHTNPLVGFARFHPVNQQKGKPVRDVTNDFNDVGGRQRS